MEKVRKLKLALAERAKRLGLVRIPRVARWVLEQEDEDLRMTAAKWLVRVDGSSMTEEERQRFYNWLLSSKRNRDEYLEVALLWEFMFDDEQESAKRAVVCTEHSAGQP